MLTSNLFALESTKKPYPSNQDYEKALKIYDPSKGNIISNGIPQYSEQEIKEATDLYRLAAEQGHPPSQFKLAQLYLKDHLGRPIEFLKDKNSEAVRLLQLAVAQEYPPAQFKLANCYKAGKIIEKNVKEAVRLYRLAANQTHLDAQMKLANWYEYGIGVERDFKEAARFYKQAWTQGWTAGQRGLERLSQAQEAQIKHDRLPVPNENYEKALKIYDPDEISTIGKGNIDYSRQDMKEAARLYNMEALHGHAPSQFKLAQLLYYHSSKLDPAGLGTACSDIFYWMAAKQRYAPALIKLAERYRDGSNGVKENAQEAARLYYLAAEQKDAHAQFCLGELYERGEGVSQSETEAIRLYQLAAKQGHLSAQINLANRYECGMGVRQDKEEAARLYESAANQGHLRVELYRPEESSDGISVSKASESVVEIISSSSKECKTLTSTTTPLGSEEKITPKLLGHQSTENPSHLVYPSNTDYEKALKIYDPSKGNWIGNGIPQYNEQQVKEATDLYRLAAEQGHPLSQFKLAQLCLSNCLGRPDNSLKDKENIKVKEAIRLFQLAAASGYPRAQFELAKCYKAGILIEKSMQEALRLYRLAAQYDKSAQFTLGEMYDRGDGVPRNEKEAIRLYRLAANQNHLDAQMWLARRYEYGIGVERDFKEAACIYQPVARQGWTAGQGGLKRIYEAQEAQVKRDRQCAPNEDYEKAIQLYDPHRIISIIKDKVEYNVEYKEQDIEKAACFYRAAALVGHAPSQFKLAQLYLYHPSSKPLAVDCSRLFYWAAKQGYAPAQLKLAERYRDGTGGFAENPQAAARLYHLAAEQKDAHAQFCLGEMYERGEGIPQNEKEAIRLYQLAANQGHLAAQMNLANRYEYGMGVEKDFRRAFYFIRRRNEGFWESGFDNPCRIWNTLVDQTELNKQYGPNEDYEKAIKIYDPDYPFNHDERQNSKEAFPLYRLAAAKGHAPSQFKLARLYLYGSDNPANVKEAVRLFSLAAQQGYAPAQIKLAERYRDGNGVQANAQEAARLYRLAAQQNDAGAKMCLSKMCERGEGVKQDKEEAIRLYESAANQGQLRVQFYRPKGSKDGIGVSKAIESVVEMRSSHTKKRKTPASTTAPLVSEEKITPALPFFRIKKEPGEQKVLLQPRHPISEKAFQEAILQIRGKSAARLNCVKNFNSMVHFILTGEKKPSSTRPSRYQDYPVTVKILVETIQGRHFIVEKDNVLCHGSASLVKPYLPLQQIIEEGSEDDIDYIYAGKNYKEYRASYCNLLRLTDTLEVMANQQQGVACAGIGLSRMLEYPTKDEATQAAQKMTGNQGIGIASHIVVAYHISKEYNNLLPKEQRLPDHERTLFIELQNLNKGKEQSGSPCMAHSLEGLGFEFVMDAIKAGKEIGPDHFHHCVTVAPMFHPQFVAESKAEVAVKKEALESGPSLRSSK